jgi:hypothetical protein
MTYEQRSPLPTVASFLVRFFIALLTLASLLVGAVVYADPASDQPGDAQLNPDTDSPVVTTNIIDDQVLSGTVPIIETVYEDAPQEYAIKLLNTDGSDVIVNDASVGVTQNPASDGELRFEWDTTTVANGTYQIVLSASDQTGNSQTKTIRISVNNQPTPPAYPPITSELTPIPEQAVTAPHSSAPKAKTKAAPSPPASATKPSEILGDQIESQLAHRLPEVAAPEQVSQDPANTCARFFGVCWYYSVPVTAVVSAGALWLYRLRNRASS